MGTLLTPFRRRLVLPDGDPRPRADGRVRRGLLAVVLGGLCVVCLCGAACDRASDDPGAAYESLAEAARTGDRHGLSAGVSARSRAPLMALVGVADAYGVEVRSPLTLLVHDAVRVTPGASADRATVWVSVHGREHAVPMVREADRWRADLMAAVPAPGAAPAETR